MTTKELLALIVRAYKWAGVPDPERLAEAFVAEGLPPDLPKRLGDAGLRRARAVLHHRDQPIRGTDCHSVGHLVGRSNRSRLQVPLTSLPPAPAV